MSIGHAGGNAEEDIRDDDMTFGKRTDPATVASPAPQAPTTGLVLAASCIAAGTIAALVTNQIIWPMLGVPDELRPFGGVQLDSMPEVTRAWAPAWIAPTAMAMSGALVWRYVALFGRKASILRGAMAMALLLPLALLAAFESLHLGQFVQSWPLIDETSLMLIAFAVNALAGVGYALFYTAFFGMLWIPVMAVIGALLAALTRATLAGVHALYGPQRIAQRA